MSRHDARYDAWRDARRVLCVRLDSMGDVLMTTPALAALRDAGAEVTLLTSPAGAAIAAMIPAVSSVIAYQAPWMKMPRDAGPAPDLALVGELRARQFDAAVVFTLHSQSPLPAAFLCQLAGVPLRAARCRENPYHLLTDWLAEDEGTSPFRHDAERQLSLVASLGYDGTPRPLSLAVPPDADAAAGDLLRALDIDPARPWCVLHPGASASSRRYHPDLYAEAARILASESGWRVLVAGGPPERLLVESIARAAGAGVISLPEPLPLPVLAALIGRAPLLVGNNSGPAHIAAALGTPVVDLYALTNPQHAPWMVPHRLLNHDVPCRNCYRSVCPEGHHHCLRLVSPVQVVQAARSLMRETHPELAEPDVATRAPERELQEAVR